MLGDKIRCCRWIYMGGYWAWVCGPGVCRGDGNNVIGPGDQILATSKYKPVLLGAASSNAGNNLTLAPVTGFDVGSFVKNNWYWLAIIGYLAFVKK